MRNSMMGMQNRGCCISPENNKQGMQADYYSGNPQYSKQEMPCYQPGISPDAPMYDMQHHERCACIPQETSIDCVMLAEAYVPFQKFCGTWPPLKSLILGTVYPELYSPYRKREYVNLEPEVSCGKHPAWGGCY